MIYNWKRKAIEEIDVCESLLSTCFMGLSRALNWFYMVMLENIQTKYGHQTVFFVDLTKISIIISSNKFNHVIFPTGKSLILTMATPSKSNTLCWNTANPTESTPQTTAVRDPAPRPVPFAVTHPGMTVSSYPRQRINKAVFSHVKFCSHFRSNRHTHTHNGVNHFAYFQRSRSRTAPRLGPQATVLSLAHRRLVRDQPASLLDKHHSESLEHTKKKSPSASFILISHVLRYLFRKTSKRLLNRRWEKWGIRTPENASRINRVIVTNFGPGMRAFPIQRFSLVQSLDQYAEGYIIKYSFYCLLLEKWIF